MKLIKKFTAVQIYAKTINDEVKVKLEYGTITETEFDRIEPETEFDTEQEAIEWAYKENKYGRWLILPLIRFQNE